MLIKKDEFIRSAEAKFNNDTFWLVAPYKVFDVGVERRLVRVNDNENALLVTYTSGGSTPEIPTYGIWMKTNDQ